MIRILIADDHPMWLSGLQNDLADKCEVVGTAVDARQAVNLAHENKPDVIVSDLNMPDGGGMYVVKQCSKDIPVLIVTASDHERDLLNVMSAGAMGYILKTASSQEIFDAIEAVSQGQPAISPTLAAFVLSEFRRMSKKEQSENDQGALSDREKEVLRLIAKGYTYRQIGEELFISAKTVENHTRNIMNKLHVHGRQELLDFISEGDFD
jgi:DNA-binding NarL/FixJ family response regulator